MRKQKSKKDLCNFNVTLGQYTRNGLKLLTSRYNMSESNVITMALNDFFKKEFDRTDLFMLLDDNAVDDLFNFEMDANKGQIPIGGEQMPDPK